MTVPAQPSHDELLFLRNLSREVDDLLEQSVLARDTLGHTFRRLLPAVRSLTGARAVAVTTPNEELAEQTWSDGEFGGVHATRLLADHPHGVHRCAGGTLVSQPLDVAGTKVGTIGLLFEGDRTAADDAARLSRTLDTVAEQLDTVLATIHTAAEKHHLILTFNRLLSNPVFEAGMDQAVAALAQRVKIPRFLILYRDAVQWNRLHYRTYVDGALEFDSATRPSSKLDAAIGARGTELIARDNRGLKDVLGAERSAEAVLIRGALSQEPLGKILVWSDADGFSTFTMDLIRVLASDLTQRLMDYNRERIHLSQFFSVSVIDQLLRDPDYEKNYLRPRDEEVGILFADINSFTRICEMVLEKPSRIGGFVDEWSEGAVRLLWEHGGVFDKMVGDCVIGLFGPPFFKSSPKQRAECAVRAALDILKFTEELSGDRELSRLAEKIRLPDMGVAIGVNLAHTYCGLFGPNRQYTGFSTGMNQTARLQALGGFREILVMEPVLHALEGTKDPVLSKASFGPVMEKPVKNVAHPLRYHALQR